MSLSRALLSVALVLAVGCGPSPGAEDAAGVRDGSIARDGSPGLDGSTLLDGAPSIDGSSPLDGSTGDGGAAGVVVSHDREVRGVWIATVFNINWPSRSGLSQAAQRAELTALFDAAARAGANAIFLQIRGEADAFYRSDLEPFSRFLTGTMGTDPGYDPLEFAVDAAHARGLELHAWMNPYRALASANDALASSGHVVQEQPDIVVPYGSSHWIDPGSAGGLAHTLAVIRDVLTRYDVDGLHFDDYFYPYPVSGVAFPDGASYAAYQSDGGTLGRSDWRRDNVHRMVEAVHDLVVEVRPDVRFGISPFGIYRPGMPEGIVGLDPYEALYADPLVWMERGWIDYLAPQLYWPTTRTGQAYDRLLDWWADRAVETGRTLLVGNYLEQLGSDPEWSVEEFRLQLDLTRAARDRNTRGNIFYHIDPIAEDRAGFASMLAADYYAAPASTPELVDAVGAAPGPPAVGVEGPDALLPPSSALRSWAAYEWATDGWALRVLSPATSARVSLWRGRWAVSAIDRHGLESLGTEVEITEGEPPGPGDPPPGLSCTHTTGGGLYAHTACSASYQCCDGAWLARTAGCGSCLCVEETGTIGCGL